jgi:hypothetical protein
MNKSNSQKIYIEWLLFRTIFEKPLPKQKIYVSYVSIGRDESQKKMLENHFQVTSSENLDGAQTEP